MGDWGCNFGSVGTIDGGMGTVDGIVAVNERMLASKARDEMEGLSAGCKNQFRHRGGT